MPLILWIAVAANIWSMAYGMILRRKLKRARGQDARLLNDAAAVVRQAGSGDYLDGRLAQLIADDLDAQATRALILGGYYDRQMRAWLRRGGTDEPPWG